MEADPTGPDFLGEAAFAGNVARIRFLLSVGVSPDAADRAGFRALHRCAVSGNSGAAETLLEAGASVDLTDAVRPGGRTYLVPLREPFELPALQFGDTALHYASYCGHDDLVGLLLDAGADALRVSSDGRTALSTAIEEGHATVVRMLVDALPRPSEGEGAARVDARAADSVLPTMSGGAGDHTPAPGHAPGGAAPPVRSMPRRASAGALALRGAVAGSLGAGAAKLPPPPPPPSHAQSVARLCDAVQAGDLRAVASLLGGGGGGGPGVDVNGVDSDGFTALHRAAVTGSVALVDALLGHGADPNARDAVRGAERGGAAPPRHPRLCCPRARRLGARRCTTPRASASRTSCTCSSRRGATSRGATERASRRSSSPLRWCGEAGADLGRCCCC